MQSRNLWPSTVKRVVICIGAEKTATSFLHRCAEKTENVCTSAVKEVHFFNKEYMYPSKRFVGRSRRQLLSAIKRNAISSLLFDREAYGEIRRSYLLNKLRSGRKFNLDTYVKYMCCDYSMQDVVFEATPMYCTLGVDIFEYIGTIHPDTRILLSLRDPVDRAWSSAKYSLRQKVERGECSREDVIAVFEKFISDPSSYVYRQSNYLEMFEKLDQAGMWDKTHVCFMENLSTEVEQNKISECFGTAVNLQIDERVNVHNQHVAEETSVLEQAADTFGDVYDAVRSRFGDRVPDGWRR